MMMTLTLVVDIEADEETRVETLGEILVAMADLSVLVTKASFSVVVA